jgi:small neutral amino acid transporter SnatA (MarC family)
MSPFWTHYLKSVVPCIHTFIPILVAIDSIGIILLQAGLTCGVPARQRRKGAVQSTATAFILCTAFFLVGKTVCRLLGISVTDFQIAGGHGCKDDTPRHRVDNHTDEVEV